MAFQIENYLCFPVPIRSVYKHNTAVQCGATRPAKFTFMNIDISS